MTSARPSFGPPRSGRRSFAHRRLRRMSAAKQSLWVTIEIVRKRTHGAQRASRLHQRLVDFVTPRSIVGQRVVDGSQRRVQGIEGCTPRRQHVGSQFPESAVQADEVLIEMRADLCYGNTIDLVDDAHELLLQLLN